MLIRLSHLDVVEDAAKTLFQSLLSSEARRRRYSSRAERQKRASLKGIKDNGLLQTRAC
jgi:hypothetical protein